MVALAIALCVEERKISVFVQKESPVQKRGKHWGRDAFCAMAVGIVNVALLTSLSGCGGSNNGNNPSSTPTNSGNTNSGTNSGSDNSGTANPSTNNSGGGNDGENSGSNSEGNTQFRNENANPFQPRLTGSDVRAYRSVSTNSTDTASRAEETRESTELDRASDEERYGERTVVTLNGQQVVKEAVLNQDNDEVDYYNYYQFDGITFVNFGTDELELDGNAVRQFRYVPPQSFPSNPTSTETVTYKGKLVETVQYNGVVESKGAKELEQTTTFTVGIGAVTTPAGTFNNCRRIEMTERFAFLSVGAGVPSTATMTGTTRINDTFAKGIGSVVAEASGEFETIASSTTGQKTVGRYSSRRELLGARVGSVSVGTIPKDTRAQALRSIGNRSSAFPAVPVHLRHVLRFLSSR